ncbi:MAG: iron-containing redox enzyme family protein [Prochloraceae cyanobacterium]|nr:iron-containing redox enzyme family protein [Prochloraceae cyanobacterium]
MKLSNFWAFFDDAKLTEEILINSSFQSIPNWNLEKLQRVCIEYRWLVKNHANHLALLVSRLPESQFKCLIAEVLNDELGNGLYEKSHLVLWDNFLKSIGVEQIPARPHKINEELFKPMSFLLINEPVDFIIGLEGVGVECICQVYLDLFRKHLVAHPFIKNNQSIDWEFWDIHTGGVDIAHKELIRKAVSELIQSEKIDPDLVLKGYNNAKQLWRDFWANFSEEKILQLNK